MILRVIQNKTYPTNRNRINNKINAKFSDQKGEIPFSVSN